MHDNAIHDLPIARSKRIAVANQPPASLTTSTKLRKCLCFVVAADLCTDKRNDAHHRVAAKNVSKAMRGRPAASVHGFVPLEFITAVLRNWIGSKCQNYESGLDHCMRRMDRLQQWASSAWMHDNAIHDLPIARSK